MQKIKSFFSPPDIVYSQPPVLIGSSSKKDGFEWYRDFIDYEKVEELTKNNKGRLAVLDDTAKTSNSFLVGKVDTVYEFTNEGGTSGFHGHHVAGIVVSNKHGLFKNTSIGLFKVLSSRNGLGASRWIAAGIEAAQIEGYEVINASLGADRLDPRIDVAVRNFCSDNKRFFVCASGNDASQTDYPAALSKKVAGVISVGAVEKIYNEYKIATFSSFGSVTVVAAGVDILSTFPEDKEEFLSGTSMATPFIAGLLSASKAIYPEFNQDTFFQVIESCVVKLEGATSSYQGHGLVKIVDFLEAVTKLAKGEKLENLSIPPKTEKMSFLKKLKSWIFS